MGGGSGEGFYPFARACDVWTSCRQSVSAATIWPQLNNRVGTEAAEAAHQLVATETVMSRAIEGL